MMVALFDAAQIERIVGLVADQEPEAIHVESPRAGEVAHAELDVACRTTLNGGSKTGSRIGIGSAGVDGWSADF